MLKYVLFVMLALSACSSPEATQRPVSASGIKPDAIDTLSSTAPEHGKRDTSTPSIDCDRAGELFDTLMRRKAEGWTEKEARADIERRGESNLGFIVDGVFDNRFGVADDNPFAREKTMEACQWLAEGNTLRPTIDCDRGGELFDTLIRKKAEGWTEQDARADIAAHGESHLSFIVDSVFDNRFGPSDEPMTRDETMKLCEWLAAGGTLNDRVRVRPPYVPNDALLVTKFPDLPPDARQFAERVASCNHYINKLNKLRRDRRAREVAGIIVQLHCDAIQEEWGDMTRKYADNPKLREALTEADRWDD